MTLSVEMIRVYLLGIVLFGVSAFAHSEWLQQGESIMGTKIYVILWHDKAEQGKKAISAVMDEMNRIDRTLSPYIESSDLFKVNAMATTQAVPVSDELFFLLQKSLYFSRISDGAFDITFASVGWHYDYRENRKPSDKQIAQLLPAINYRWVELDKKNKTVAFKHEDVRIDLGGIAKGYAVDRAIEILKEYGVAHASVSAGGDTKILGDKKGRPWIVGIKHPRTEKQSKDSVIRLPLENTALSTSGDYERYFIDEQSGERIHHIINPRTGKSAHDVVSVTILGDNGIDTDALSTTVFVLGVVKGLALINKLPRIDCIVIDQKGKVHYSNGLMPAG